MCLIAKQGGSTLSTYDDLKSKLKDFLICEHINKSEYAHIVKRINKLFLIPCLDNKDEFYVDVNLEKYLKPASVSLALNSNDSLYKSCLSIAFARRKRKVVLNISIVSFDEIPIKFIYFVEGEKIFESIGFIDSDIKTCILKLLHS